MVGSTDATDTSRSDDQPHPFDRDAEQSLSEDMVVIYDRENTDSWIQSGVTVTEVYHS